MSIPPNTRTTLGVIGAGWLGCRLAQGAIEAKLISENSLSLSYRSRKPDRFTQAFWTRESQQVCDRASLVLLAVRPEDWAGLNITAPNALVVSVVAGLPLRALADKLGTDRIVRAVPNAASDVKLSHTPWIASAGTSATDKQIAETLLGTCGLTDEVSSEDHIDYLTGFSGTGPAYPSLLAEAMITHALGQGIDRPIAERAVRAMLMGAGAYLAQNPTTTPSDIVRLLDSYRGVTAAGMTAMTNAGFTDAVHRGLEAAAQSSRDLVNE